MESRSHWRTAAAELARARAQGQITDDDWFDGMCAMFDAAYPTGDNPRTQSGFGGDEARWEEARRPIADAVDRDGTFLDVGCANGYLIECLLRWTPHHIEPYGLEIAPTVAGLARERLPQWADRIYVGNALTWHPLMRFDFVRTELVYVPDERHNAFLERLLNDVVTPRGRLIVCGYGSPRSGIAAHPVRRIVRSHGFEPEVELEVEAPEGGGPIIELAVLRAGARRAYAVTPPSTTTTAPCM